MNTVSYFVGIDVADESFAAACYRAADQPVFSADGFANELDGFEAFIEWMRHNNLIASETIICIEATGIYSEALCYYLYQNHYRLWLESPDKVKHAFKLKGHKTDPVDATQIAEYACRYIDRCRLWEPKSHIIEQLNTLLSARELLVEQRTAILNALKPYRRKMVSTPMVIRHFEANVKALTQQIKQMEKEMRRLIDSNSQYRRLFHLFHSSPGIALLAAANLLVVTNGGTQLTESPKLAAYLGICPYQHRSGSSVKKRAKSAQLGPQRLRKLLHLAARSLAHSSNNEHFRNYYQRKSRQGKPPRLIYNNIANKIIRILCALIRDQKTYDSNYVSINPNF